MDYKITTTKRIIPSLSKLDGRVGIITKEDTSVPAGFILDPEAMISLLEQFDDPNSVNPTKAGDLIDAIEENMPVNPETDLDLKKINLKNGVQIKDFNAFWEDDLWN